MCVESICEEFSPSQPPAVFIFIQTQSSWLHSRCKYTPQGGETHTQWRKGEIFVSINSFLSPLGNKFVDLLSGWKNKRCPNFFFFHRSANYGLLPGPGRKEEAKKGREGSKTWQTSPRLTPPTRPWSFLKVGIATTFGEIRSTLTILLDWNASSN